MDDLKLARRVHVHLPDQMRYFARNGPLTKLVALLICKLPALVFAAVIALSTMTKMLG